MKQMPQDSDQMLDRTLPDEPSLLRPILQSKLESFTEVKIEGDGVICPND